LTSNIFRPDERVRLKFLTNVFPNYSVFSSGTVNFNNCCNWSVTKTQPCLQTWWKLRVWQCHMDSPTLVYSMDYLQITYWRIHCVFV